MDTINAIYKDKEVKLKANHWLQLLFVLRQSICCCLIIAFCAFVPFPGHNHLFFVLMLKSISIAVMIPIILIRNEI